jgi:hypothetical protein
LSSSFEVVRGNLVVNLDFVLLRHFDIMYEIILLKITELKQKMSLKLGHIFIHVLSFSASFNYSVYEGRQNDFFELKSKSFFNKGIITYYALE